MGQVQIVDYSGNVGYIRVSPAAVDIGLAGTAKRPMRDIEIVDDGRYVRDIRFFTLTAVGVAGQPDTTDRKSVV